MSTTHKSLDGPRGAVLLTTDAAIAKKIDKAVFPGEQGGPHVNVFAALALTFKLAQTAQFKKLQAQTIKNAKAMASQFKKRGLRVPFGGTDCHLVNVDCTTVKGEDGTALSGDQAARILDIVGIVVNRNTIPGDKNSADPSGIRLGTPWITQRGFDEKKTRVLADIMADVLLACAPHSVDTPHKGRVRRAKLDFMVLNDAKLKVRKLAESAGIDFKYKKSGYPHFYYIDDKSTSGVFELSGSRVRQMLDYAVSSDLSALKKGGSQATSIATPKGLVKGTLSKVDDMTYQLQVSPAKAGAVGTWLRDLSDGYTSFRLDGKKDFTAARMPGPSVVANGRKRVKEAEGRPVSQDKPWFIGDLPKVSEEPHPSASRDAKPPFEWIEPAEILRQTKLFDDPQIQRREGHPVRGLGDAGLVHVGGGGTSRDARGGGTVRRLAHGRVRGEGPGGGLLPGYDLRQRLRRTGTRREPVQPVPDARGGCDRRYAGVPPGMGQVPGGGERLER